MSIFCFSFSLKLPRRSFASSMAFYNPYVKQSFRYRSYPSPLRMWGNRPAFPCHVRGLKLLLKCSFGLLSKKRQFLFYIDFITLEVIFSRYPHLSRRSGLFFLMVFISVNFLNAVVFPGKENAGSNPVGRHIFFIKFSRERQPENEINSPSSKKD